MREIKKEIREDWFKDHIANYEEVNERLRVLDWKRTQSSTYRVRYVMDGSYLYISGDLGEAVFNLTWEATLESFQDINLGYFHSKLSAYGDNKKYWDSEEAKDRLQEEVDELEKNFVDYGYKTIDDEELIDRVSLLETMQDIADDCSTSKEWESRISFEGYDPLFEQLQKYDNDCWEWIFAIGDTIPGRVRAYWIGLKMAFEQLEGDKNERS